MIKLLSLFSGIGAFEKALSNIDEPYKTLAWCEIDKFASRSYCAIHGEKEENNLGDVCNVHMCDRLRETNLITWGFPCTQISLSGTQKGFVDDDGNLTASGLFFEGLRVIQEIQPCFAICENVAALATSKKWTNEFKIVLDSLSEAGYENYWKVLDARDYGVPQHRERVFIVSVRKDIARGFDFPKPFPLDKCIRDILEPENEIEEKHYLKPSRLEKLIWYNPPIQSHGIVTSGSLNTGYQRDRVLGVDGVAQTLAATDYKQPAQIDVRQIAKLDSHRNNPNQYRVYDDTGLSPTLTTMGGGGRQPHIPVNGGVRRFTPLECLRLMGFDDKDYKACKDVKMSDVQIYRQAGNSIVVDVLEEIFVELLNQYADVIDAD